MQTLRAAVQSELWREAVALDLAGAKSVLHALRAQLDAARGARLRWSAAGAITR